MCGLLDDLVLVAIERQVSAACPGVEELQREERISAALLNGTPHVISAHLYKKVPYDALKDFTHIAIIASGPYALVVNPATGIKSIEDLIKKAKTIPGKLDYASAGNGSGQHLYVELLKSVAGINLVHVPYKGAAPALQAVLSGEPAIMLEVTVAVVPHVKAGKLRALMVTGSKPLDSKDPEFLYLYGRALMLTGNQHDASTTFSLAIANLTSEQKSSLLCIFPVWVVLVFPLAGASYGEVSCC